MMKLGLAAVLVAVMMAPGIVRAEKDGGKKDAGARVETQVTGQVITVGPDGKIQIEKLGDGAGDLGIDLQGILQGTLKDVTKKSGEKDETRVFSFGKAFKIGPDGKMEELESLPKNIQNLMKKGGLGNATIQGSITVIGPDGKAHTQPLGDGKLDVDSISKSIEKALEGTGKELPEGLEGVLKDALKGLPDALSAQIGDALSSGQDTTAQKLDEIFKRLDKLEKEVHRLKANQK